MAFSLKRTVDLSEFGWADCSIVLQGATWNEVVEWEAKFKNIDEQDRKTQEQVFGILEQKFLSGTALDENDEKVEIKKEQLKDLPLDVVIKCLASLRGSTPDPNL